MSRLRPIEARRLVSFLVKNGFRVVGQTGSHAKLGLVLKILKQAGFDPHAIMDEL